jgi:hypothetical protein
MQSLHALRLLLNVAAFALAFRASSKRAWSVVEPPSRAGWDGPYASVESRVPASSQLIQLTFSPTEYCLDAFNGSSDCHSYAYLLTQPDRSSSPLNLTSAGLGDEKLLAATATNRLQAATSSWCVATASPPPSSSTGGPGSGNSSGAWLLQGAQSLMCLVVLETCLYSAILWQLLGLGSVLGALATFCKWRAFEGGAGFATLAQAALGMLVVVEWAGYAMHMMDVGYVAVLQLVVHFGPSFWLAILSTVIALLSCRVSTKISSPLSTSDYAKLHALPPSPRSGVSSPASRDRPEIEDEDATLDCLEQAVDPLKCPANYRQ